MQKPPSLISFSPIPSIPKSKTKSLRQSTLVMAGLTFIALLLADLEISTANPWHEISLMAEGFIHPNVLDWNELLSATFKTLAFAIQGVIVAAILGFMLALCFGSRIVRILSAFIRAIHELFWALLFIQITGFSPLTAFLAILIPYSGIFAKVFSEILDEIDNKPLKALNPSTSFLNRILFARAIMAWPQIITYVKYRLECGIRSSAVLGFVGLPTLGFELESFFKQGDYAEAAALIYVFFIIVASLKFVIRTPLIPLYTLIAFVYLPPAAYISFDLITVFFTHDIVPAPLRESNYSGLYHWCLTLWKEQALEGIINSLVLTQIALFFTALLALFLFPFSSAVFFNKTPRALGQTLLIIMRSFPEYLLAFIGLLLLGPSMLPAIIALALHNGAIIAHLMAQQSRELVFRLDHSHGVNLYFFDVLPRLYGQFMALLFYRLEVILRETALLGILGIPTLGFYIDSAFEEIRFDRAVYLILITALLNILVDHISVYTRKRLHINNQPESL
jgi:phosphonate transport system permease protein